MTHQVVIIGSTETNFRFNNVKDSLVFTEYIPSGSLEWKLLKFITGNDLRKVGDKISIYKRVYILVGHDITEQFTNNEENFMKTLKGETVFSIIKEYDISLLNLIRYEIQVAQNQVRSSVSVQQLERSLALVNKEIMRDLNKVRNINTNQYDNFFYTKNSISYLQKQLNNVDYDVSPRIQYRKLKRGISERWQKISTHH